MLEYHAAFYAIEDGQPLPKPNRRARDKKAERVEPIRIGIRVQAAPLP